MIAERWLPVVGFEGLYEVSDLGRVRSLGRVDALGRSYPPLILAQEVKTNGRHRVKLCDAGRQERRQVHRLVLEAFVGQCPDGLEACHWNDDPHDNRLSNLRWDTKGANSRDAVRNGTHGMARKSNCPSGHPYDLTNTYVRPGSNHRQCRQCTRDQQRAARRTSSREAA